MVAVPCETPVTNPVVSTVATLVSDDVHAFVVAAVVEPVNCVLCPTHADKVPVILGWRGFVKTIELLFKLVQLLNNNEKLL